MMGARATPWDAEVLGLFVCQLASALRKGIKDKTMVEPWLKLAK